MITFCCFRLSQCWIIRHRSLSLIGSNGKFHYLMVLSYNQHYQIRSPRYPCFWVDRKRNSFMWEMHLESLVRQFIQPSSAFSFHFTKLLSLFYINFLPFSTDSVVVLKFKLLGFQQRPNWIIEIECVVQRLQWLDNRPLRAF